MGGVLSAIQIDSQNPLVQKISEITPKDLEDTLEFYAEYYPDLTTLNFEQFDDIFSPVFNDIEETFGMVSGGKEVVDWYETLALVVLGCNAQPEAKVAYLFQLFDFDGSGNISTKEFQMTLEACIRGLSKVGSGFPKKTSVNRALHQVFQEIDSDDNRELDFEEILNWVKRNQEIQETMATLSNIQNLDLAKLKFTQLCESYKAAFTKDSQDGKVAQTQQLRENLLKFEYIKSLSSEELNSLMKLMDNSSQVKLEDFEEAIKNFAAFEIADFTRNKELDKGETRVMMSFKTGINMDLSKVEKLIRVINSSEKPSIHLADWLEFLRVPSAKDISVGLSLKRAFDNLDEDCSFTLDKEEIKKLVESTFKENLCRFLSSDEIEAFISRTVASIFEGFSSTELDWVQFKNYFSVIEEKVEIAIRI